MGMGRDRMGMGRDRMGMGRDKWEWAGKNGNNKRCRCEIKE